MNDYLFKFIFDTINTRLKYLMSKDTHIQIHTNNKILNKPNR